MVKIVSMPSIQNELLKDPNQFISKSPILPCRSERVYLHIIFKTKISRYLSFSEIYDKVKTFEVMEKIPFLSTAYYTSTFIYQK